MEKSKTKDKLVIKDTVNFKAKDIFECGQLFRFFKNDDGHYTVFALDKKADVFEHADYIEIVSYDIDFFQEYFDLERDYSTILKKYGQYDFLGRAYDFGKGIRILNQDLVEVVFSFLISSNNNIKRIKLIIDRICNAIGKDCGTYHAFPTIEEWGKCSEEFFKQMGAGYRASYLFKTAQALNNGFDLKSLYNLDTKQARKKLLTLCGIGPKVADCILLFGLRKFDVFPVDTWIEKVYHAYFESGLTNRVDITDFLVDLFGIDSGFVQQYLFYYQRENFN